MAGVTAEQAFDVIDEVIDDLTDKQYFLGDASQSDLEELRCRARDKLLVIQDARVAAAGGLRALAEQRDVETARQFVEPVEWPHRADGQVNNPNALPFPGAAPARAKDTLNWGPGPTSVPIREEVRTRLVKEMMRRAKPNSIVFKVGGERLLLVAEDADGNQLVYDCVVDRQCKTFAQVYHPEDGDHEEWEKLKNHFPGQ